MSSLSVASALAAVAACAKLDGLSAPGPFDASAGEACVPQCAGRQCGSDGCGGVCGSCASGVCNGLGTCEPEACATSWKVTVPGVTFLLGSRVAQDGKTLFLAGQGAAGGAWVGAVDSCRGTLTASTTVNPPDGGALYPGVAVGPDALHAFGTLVTQPEKKASGFHARLDKGTLAVGSDGVQALSPQTPTFDELNDAVVSPGTQNLWFVGTTDGFANPAPWGNWGSSQQGASLCSFRPPIGGAPARGKGARILAANGSFYVSSLYDPTGNQGFQVRVHKYAEGNPCSDSPTLLVDKLVVGTSGTDARAMAAHGNSIYLAGFGTDFVDGGSGDPFGWVAQIDATTGVVQGTFRLDPSPAFDAFTALAVDASRKVLYVGGGAGWDGSATFASATARLLALPLDLRTVPLVPTWQTTIDENVADYVSGIAVDATPAGAGAVFVAGIGPAGAFVMRCEASGACPQ